MRPTLHDYVIDVYDKADTTLESCATALDYVNDFAKLTNRAPRLGDFITCDEDGNVLKRTSIDFETGKVTGTDLKEWIEADNRVIFKGDWEVIHDGENSVQIVDSGREFSFRYSKRTKEFTLPKINRIEDLPREIEFKEGVI